MHDINVIGSLQHMAEVLLEGRADAVLAASIGHFADAAESDRDPVRIPVRKLRIEHVYVGDHAKQHLNAVIPIL